jgi:hypothetical protein
MPPTLIGLAYLDAVRPKHLPPLEYVDLTTSNHALKDWKILVQGSQVIFLSPPGWKPGHSPTGAKVPPDAPSVLIQIPRTRLALYWSGDEGDIGQLERWPAVKAEGKGGR